MTRSSDPYLQALVDQLDEVFDSEVPNLVKIREYRQQIFAYLAECVIEVMQSDAKEDPSDPDSCS